MNSFRVIKRLFSYVARYKSAVLTLVILSFIGVAFEVLKPIPVKYILDNVLSGRPIPGTLEKVFEHTIGVPGRMQLLAICIGAMITFILGGTCISLLVSHITTRACQRMVHDLSVDLFDKLQRLNLFFYSKNKVGELLQRLSGDVYVVYSLVAQILLPLLMSLTSLIAMFYIMASINLLLACIAISVVPALMILLYVFNKPMTDTTVQQYSLLGELSAFIQQSLSSIKVIQAYSREKFTNAIFKQQSEKYSRAFVKSTKVSVLYVMLTALITGLAGALVIGIGAYRVLNGQISIGDLFIFLGYISALFGPVNSLSSTIAVAVTLNARGKRIFELLDSDETVTEKPDAIAYSNMKGNIEFRDITFGYNRMHAEPVPVIRNFSCKVNSGQIVAVIGPTGAGKTSLVSLLLRFYDPWKGNIYIDGIDIADMKLSSLREGISLVLQDAFIFPVSIAENIGFGDPEATLDQIMEAAKAAEAHDFIMRLPDGYQSIVSEGGVSLSGGEKQRISLARALLRKSPILILDEPTSALDMKTESKIFSALSEYARDKTVFIITHRLATIKHADLIITIKDGVLAESGTHDSLLENNRVYADLYKFYN